ncbi:MAG: protein phosphatase CheZ [Alphaproteobacteria bacterium]|nr:protein phosphatase CheZ [Alphaproteobacteria bacterium]
MSDLNVSGAGSVYEKDQVIKIINSVIAKVEQAEETSRESIFRELKDLQDIIEKARSEIGAARPNDINDKHIPTATDELDAVVESTAEATGKIMDSCDVIQEKAESVGGQPSDDIVAEVMKIYEACSFQDITGQRITKVVGTLKEIEGKVGALVKVLSQNMPGLHDASNDEGEDQASAASDDSALLNGPQMPDKAITQDDIDALLAEFD